MDVVDNNDFLDVFMYLVVVFGCLIMTRFTIFYMDVVDNNDFSCIWLLKTIFTFSDVVDNNDFLNVFHVFGC